MDPVRSKIAEERGIRNVAVVFVFSVCLPSFLSGEVNRSNLSLCWLA